MPPNWAKIFLRLHRTVPEKIPMQSRTNLDTRAPITDKSYRRLQKISYSFQTSASLKRSDFLLQLNGRL